MTETKYKLTFLACGILAGLFQVEQGEANLPAIDCSRQDTFCTDEFVQLTQNTNSMDTVLNGLPAHLLRNFTLKRGNNIEKSLVGILGPHGHRTSPVPSNSASPEQPRIIAWDELTGFTASWNSGNTAHSANDRIDLYDFDFSKKQHHIMPWIPGKGVLTGDYIDNRGVSCKQCHGEVQRPIFPMYPDWPQFYGEFNDEMAGYKKGELAIRSDLRVMGNDFQPKESKLYFEFLEHEAKTNSRYSPIYSHMNKLDLENKYYPYRPRNTTSPFSDTSRAFYYRPNLRLGLLYNRLTALQTFEKIKNSDIFQKFPDIIFYSFLDCNWNFNFGNSTKERQEILGTLLKEVQSKDNLKEVNLRGTSFAENELNTEQQKSFFKEIVSGTTRFFKTPSLGASNYQQIPYEDLLKILKLEIADMDIRFKHDSGLRVKKGYGVYDPKSFYFTDNAMDIGYLNETYKMNPICDNKNSPCHFTYENTYMEGMRYFNSYFDGSATMNELLAAQILLYLTDSQKDFSKNPELNKVRTQLISKIKNPRLFLETLSNKYSRYTKRLALDKPFFDKMDAIGPWIQLPFPPMLLNIQNRESFWGGGRTEQVRLRHAQWVSLEDRKQNKKNLNQGQNLCWNIYEIMKNRYLKN